ncbi:hypothetical protein [Thermus sp.]
MVERKLSPEEYPALEAEERLEYEEGRLFAMAGDSRDHVYRKTEGGILYEVYREGRVLLDCPQGALDLRGIFP